LNSDHAVGGISVGAATSALTVVLQHFQGVSADVAGAETILALMGLGILYGVASAVLSRWHMQMPPLPAPAPPAA
jgi:hypothetical protein